MAKSRHTYKIKSHNMIEDLKKKNEHLLEVYQTILLDVQEGRNLNNHLRDVEAAITDLKAIISSSEASGQNTQSFESILNDLYYLKYEISERM